MLNVSATTCTCRGYDPADPCGHGDVADGCPAHDPLSTRPHASAHAGRAGDLIRKRQVPHRSHNHETAAGHPHRKHPT